MFTVCVIVFASLVATEPVKADCWAGKSKAQVAGFMAGCQDIAHDPFMTCEPYRLSADKWLFTVRKLEGV